MPPPGGAKPSAWTYANPQHPEFRRNALRDYWLIALFMSKNPKRILWWGLLRAHGFVTIQAHRCHYCHKTRHHRNHKIYLSAVQLLIATFANMKHTSPQ